MSFRSICIVSKDDEGKSHLLFSRKYPTVERRHNLIHGKTSSQTITDDNLIQSVFTKLQIGRKTKEFLADNDGCQQSRLEPVLELNINGETLWPVIAIQKFNFIFICVCLVEKKEFDSSTPLVEIPAVSIGYAMLHNIIEFLEMVPLDNGTQLSSQIEDLGMLLKMLMPFGTPSDINFNMMKSFLAEKEIEWSPKYRLSAWRPPTDNKTKNQLHLTIQEQVNATIYNDREMSIYKDMCQVYGTVSCKAEVAGVPEVSLSLPSNSNIHIAFHPCLQLVDVTSNGKSGLLGNSSTDYYQTVQQLPVYRNVCFIPPHEVFPLCHMNGDVQFPVKGSFELKKEGELTRVHVQLQLSERVKNLFEYFEVHIPFFQSRVINKCEFDNACGTVLVSPDKRNLVWSLGTKFPKSLKTAMTAFVLLESPENEENILKKDHFCHGLNAYMQIFFKSKCNILSGINIDPKSVKLNLSSSPKVNITKEMVSKDFKIWNRHGDAIVAFPPTL